METTWTSPVQIGLTVRSDTIATTRCLNALNMFVDDQKRTTGAHLHSILFGGTAGFDQISSWFTRRQVHQWEEYIENQEKLNASQRTAALAPTLSENGVTIIHGSPGTGKTHVSAAIVGAALSAGMKVMVVGGTNQAVDEALTKMIGHNHPDAKMVRFRSTFARWGKPQNAEHAIVTGADEEIDDRQAVLQDMILSMTKQGYFKHAEYGFGVQRDAFVACNIRATKETVLLPSRPRTRPDPSGFGGCA